MTIDAHQHFWVLNRFTPNFPKPEHGAIYRSFLPEDLEPVLAAAGVEGTVVVQAAPALEETEWLLNVTASRPWVRGVVGWVDLDQPPGALRRDLNRLVRFPKLVGVRPMLQDLPDLDWILRPQVVHNLRQLADHQLTLDLLIYDRHIPAVLRALPQVPALCAVVDHAAKPEIRTGAWEPWASRVARLATLPQVSCKVSGLVTEANPDRWGPLDLTPYIRHVVSAFGPGRVMFGSDRPVCLEVTSYQRVYDTVREWAGTALSHAERESLFGLNAARFYHLPSV